MGLCKTSDFSIFPFINASDLKFCTPFLQQLCISHDAISGSNGKVSKMMTSHRSNRSLVEAYIQELKPAGF